MILPERIHDPPHRGNALLIGAAQHDLADIRTIALAWPSGIGASLRSYATGWYFLAGCKYDSEKARRQQGKNSDTSPDLSRKAPGKPDRPARRMTGRASKGKGLSPRHR